MRAPTAAAAIASLLLAARAIAAEPSPFAPERVDGPLHTFRGEATLEGRFTYDALDPLTGRPEVCFQPDGPSAAALASVDGVRRRTFCFEDALRARELLGIPAALERGACRVTGRARVTVTAYVADATEGDVSNHATLASVAHAALAPPPREPPRAVDQGASVVFETPLEALGVRLEPAGGAAGLQDPLRARAPRPGAGARVLRPRRVRRVARRRARLAGQARARVRAPLAGVRREAAHRARRDRAGRGAVIAVLQRTQRGPKASAAVFELGSPGAHLVREHPFAGATSDVFVLAGGTLLREETRATASARGAVRWSVHPAQGVATAAALPDRRSAAARLGEAVLFTTRDGGLVRVDARGAPVRVRGCDRCGVAAADLVGGTGELFGCILSDRTGQARDGWFRHPRILRLCRVAPDGSAAEAGERALEADTYHEDACHFRSPLPGARALDGEGNYFEVEAAAGAPRRAVRTRGRDRSVTALIGRVKTARRHRPRALVPVLAPAPPPSRTAPG